MITEENIAELVETDIIDFNNLIKEFPKFKTVGGLIYEQIKNHYVYMTKILIKEGGAKLYYHSFVIFGSLVRSLNAYKGVLWALSTKNIHVCYDSLRFQYETLALLNYCNLNPDNVVKSIMGGKNSTDEKLKVPNIVTLVEKIDKKYGKLKQDYDKLSNYLHPNPESFFAHLFTGDYEEGKSLKITFSTKSPYMDEDYMSNYINSLINLTKYIFSQLDDLIKFLNKLNKKT